jgi:hypothetical protein
MINNLELMIYVTFVPPFWTLTRTVWILLLIRKCVDLHCISSNLELDDVRAVSDLFASL